MKARIPLPNDLKSAVKTEIAAERKGEHNMIGFIIGVFVGVILGVVIMALMAAAKGGDEEMMLFMTDQHLHTVVAIAVRRLIGVIKNERI